MSGMDRRSLIFAWSRPWPDFPDTFLSTISDDRRNSEIPDLFQTYENQASIWSSSWYSPTHSDSTLLVFIGFFVDALLAFGSLLNCFVLISFRFGLFLSSDGTKNLPKQFAS